MQTISSIPVEQVDSAQSTTVNTGEYIQRTTIQLPQPIDLNHKPAITGVTTMYGEDIQFTNRARAQWQKHRRYSGSAQRRRRISLAL